MPELRWLDIPLVFIFNPVSIVLHVLIWQTAALWMPVGSRCDLLSLRPGTACLTAGGHAELESSWWTHRAHMGFGGDFILQITQKQKGQPGKPAVKYSRLAVNGQHLASVQGSSAHLPPDRAFRPPVCRVQAVSLCLSEVRSDGRKLSRKENSCQKHRSQIKKYLY